MLLSFPPRPALFAPADDQGPTGGGAFEVKLPLAASTAPDAVTRGYLDYLQSVLVFSIKAGASDIFIAPNLNPKAEVGGKFQDAATEPLDSQQVEQLLYSMTSNDARLANYISTEVEQRGHADFSWSVQEADAVGRFRINVARAHSGYVFSMRLLPDKTPEFNDLGLPASLLNYADSKSGLILITGQTGSGKSTTAASLLNHLSKKRSGHIVTVENPIEYIIPSAASLVTQRELGSHVSSFSEGLRAALRMHPKVIVIGEMRDEETMRAALSAAETGHLVISTLHTSDVAQTVQRVLGEFPEGKRQGIRASLADSLLCVCCQQLIPNTKGGRSLAYEYLPFDHAIRNLVREAKEAQLPNYFKKDSGAQKLDEHLARLWSDGMITEEEALRHARDKTDLMSRRVRR
jgi:twitching motility protein PilT